MFPTANIVQRVFNMGVPIGDTGMLRPGTAFVLNIDGREYLVTARHVVEGVIGDILVIHEQKWVRHSANMVGRGNDNIDVAVLALATPLVAGLNGLPVRLGMEGITYGQETMFLGFPTGYDSGSSVKLENGYPIPLVKYARLSSMPPRGHPMWLDGHINPGFSGSPLCFVPDEEKPTELAIAGVVVANTGIKSEVYQGEEKAETDMYVFENMGLGQAWDIQHVLEIVDKNPIGLPITS